VHNLRRRLLPKKGQHKNTNISMTHKTIHVKLSCIILSSRSSLAKLSFGVVELFMLGFFLASKSSVVYRSKREKQNDFTLYSSFFVCEINGGTYPCGTTLSLVGTSSTMRREDKKLFEVRTPRKEHLLF
jgi:hypothetical protein